MGTADAVPPEGGVMEGFKVVAGEVQVQGSGVCSSHLHLALALDADFELRGPFTGAFTRDGPLGTTPVRLASPTVEFLPQRTTQVGPERGVGPADWPGDQAEGQPVEEGEPQLGSGG
jgi:hypothetical protein